MLNTSDKYQGSRSSICVCATVLCRRWLEPITIPEPEANLCCCRLYDVYIEHRSPHRNVIIPCSHRYGFRNIILIWCWGWKIFFKENFLLNIVPLKSIFQEKRAEIIDTVRCTKCTVWREAKVDKVLKNIVFKQNIVQRRIILLFVCPDYYYYY